MLKKLSFMAYCLIVVAFCSRAQSVTNYGFTFSTGTFTALSGATSPTISGGNEDEGYFNALPIGFDFWYMGTRYTTVSASTNGWLTLGANITNATPANSLSANGAPRPVLAILWDDLALQPSTKVSYLTTGSAGSRIFTVQYLNEKWQATATGNTISFQARLYENTGKVEYVYRPESGSTITPSASVGISALSTGSGNFLSVGNGGTSVSSTVEANVTTRPVAGKAVDFTPPVPAAPSTLAFSGITNSAMTLSWSDLSSNEIGFVIYSSPDGVTYSFVTQTSANATSSTQSGLTPNTLYYWKVYAVTEGALSASLSASQSTICTGGSTLTGTSTETCVGGSTGTITATATGGAPPYTYSLNAGAYQSSATFTGLAAATYTVNVLGTSGCVSSISVTVNPYATSADDQNATTLDSWIGHVYDGISFGNYIGHYTETENFNELFGGTAVCFNVVSNSLTRSIFTETFSVKYKMTSSKKGLYAVDLGSDDGTRLTVDGVMPYNSFLYQSFILRPSVLINLNGASSLLYEYFENSGTNQVMFQNLTLVFSNTLSTNTSQIICIGNTALTISGNTYGALPSGITLSGTGYQWSYSTTPVGARTPISGATGATLTPSTAAAPFNAAGTYYVYRNATLSSVNNISPNPYVASNESNSATVVVNAGGQWTGSVSTDWSNANNWCIGIVPTATTDVIITSSAIRMPSIISSVVCNNLTINTGASLTTTSTGTLNIGGTLTNNGTITNNGTTNFNGTSGQQTFSGVSSFYNLTLNNSAGLLLPAPITINNNLTITAGTLNANNFNTTVKGNWVNNASATAFTTGTTTTTFSGTAAQSIGGSFATTFNNLIIANTASTVTLNNTISVTGDLTVASGIFDLASFSANRASAGGILTVANNATLKIGGANTYPANYATNTLVVASTIEYSGTNQTVSNQVYGNLTLSSASGAATKTFPATAITIVGNLTSTVGTGTSVSFTAGANSTVNGNVAIGASTIFNGGNYAHTIGGFWTNNGTFNGNNSTIILTGSAISVSGTGTQNFDNLTATASGIVFSSPTIGLTGNLATTGAGSVSQASSTTLSMSGTGTIISGSGISLENLNISGTVTTSASFTLTGNMTVSGSFAASTGSITMSGSSKTISGTGTKNFSTLSVTGAVTTASNFSVSSGLSVNGSLTATAGTATFTGASTLSGAANLFNTTLNGTTLQLSTNSTLGIGNLLMITAGTLDITSLTPNTINFNGAGAQNINAITYNNLTLSGGNSKTALASITVNNTITIGVSTTFIPGSFTHSIYNDWINNGSFTAGASTIQFLGTATSTITGNTTFNILTINNATADTQIILASNASAAIVNMTNGTLLTGTNKLTITNTRTGPGNIYGTIQRTHAFTTGVVYEFKNPNNTVLFSTVSSVTSITVSIDDSEVADFPFGGSVHVGYTIAVPAGTYNATLRLAYEDDELNGNAEATMGLWNYNGSSWMAIGKTANSTTSNYVEKSGLTNITNRWTLSDNANVVQWNGSVSTAWSTAANWTAIQGSPSTPPVAADIVELGSATFTNQPTISTSVTTNNILFGSTKAVTLTLASGGSLTATGNIAGNWSANASHAINVNNQTVTINGDFILSDGTANQSINLSIGSGIVNISGSLIQSGDAAISFSSTGTLNIFNDYTRSGGTFSAGSGTVVYNGTSNQNVANVTYNDLSINKTAGLASISSALTVGGKLTVAAGELDSDAATSTMGDVTISSGAIFQNNNVLQVGGNWINNGTYDDAGTTLFNGSGTQTITATSFNNFTINKTVGTSATLIGNVVLDGDLTVSAGTLNIKTFDCNRSVLGGTLTLGSTATFIVSANNSPLNFANGNLATTSTVIADGVNPQLIFGLNFGNLIFRNGGLKTLVSPITVYGDLTIESGATFDGGSQTLTINGNWINNGTYIPSNSTTLQSGLAKTISGNTTFNKVTISGTYTNLANITYNDLLHITSSGSISASAGILTTLNGDLINNGVLYTLGTTTFTGTVLQTLSLINAVNTVALIVNFNGTVSPVLNSTSTPQYGYLTINNTGGVNPSVDWTILYSLTVSNGASFNSGVTTQNIYGAVTNNGAITSSGVLNFIPASAATINMGSTFSSTGLVNFGGAGAFTLAGTPASFHDVAISNTNGTGITPSSNWTITNNLTVNNGATLNASSYSFLVGGNISNTGSINSGASSFTLNGSTTQDIYSPSAFNNLTLNKPAANVTLSSNVTVNSILNFITGQIRTGSNTLIQPSTGTITGAAQATGWVNGKLQKSVGTGATSKTFETGDAASYTPVSITFASVTNAGTLVVSTTTGDYPSISSSGVNPSKSVNRYWTLTNSGIVFTTYDATFNFVASDIDAGANTAAFGVKLYDGTSWLLTTVTSPNATNITATGNTVMGDFVIGEICNAGTTISYASSPYCSSSGIASATITGTTGGAYTSLSGLSINAASGDITLSTSTEGVYTVTYTIAAAGSCAAQIVTTPVTVTTAPTATLSYPGSPYIISVATASITFTGTPSGTYTSTPGLSLNSLTGLVTLNTSTAATYTVTYTVPAFGGCSVYTNATSITLLNNLKTWDGGAITSNWGDGNNWNPDGVPVSLDNIDLTSANTINVNVAGVVNNITLNNTGLTLNITSGNSLAVAGNLTLTSGTLSQGGSNSLNLTVAGDWVNNGGTYIPNTNNVGFVGTSLQNISGTSPTSFNNISITNTANPGVRIQSDQNLRGVLTLASNVFFDADGSSNTSVFRLISSGDNPTQDAAIGILPAGSQITGNITVQRYMAIEGPNNTKIYRYISSPVQNATVADIQNEIPITGPFTGTSVCTGCTAVSLFYYDETITTDTNASGTADLNDGYINFPPVSNTETFSPGEGYAMYVRGNLLMSALWDVSGLVNTGNVSPVALPVTFTSSGNIANDGWNLVGNPFPSTIDWNAASGWTKTNLDAPIYISDNGNTALQYATWNGVTGTNGGSRYIATGQGFWIKANGSGTPMLQTTENSKVSGTQTPFFREGNLDNLLRIKMAQGSIQDETVIHFRNDATPGFDHNADAWKLKNGLFNLASLSDSNEILAINSWSALQCTTSVKLSVEDAAPGQYTLTFTNLDSFTDAQVTLTDLFTTQTTPVSENTVYVFQVTNDANSLGNSRFALLINKNKPAVVILEAKGVLSVDYTSNIQWYFNNQLIAGATASNFTPDKSGTYSVIVNSNGCDLTGSVVFSITGLEELLPKGISVFPNPVSSELFITSDKINIQSVTILNVLGEIMGEIQLKSTQGQQSGSFAMGDQSVGIYFLKISDGSHIYTRKIIRK